MRFFIPTNRKYGEYISGIDAARLCGIMVVKLTAKFPNVEFVITGDSKPPENMPLSMRHLIDETIEQNWPRWALELFYSKTNANL